MMAMRRIGSKVLGVLAAATLIAGTFVVALADGPVGPTGTPLETASPDLADATYDETQPGADDPRVKEGFAAYQAGDFEKAYAIWLPLAEAGNAEAQFRVGRLYHLGEIAQFNLNLALEWYSSAIRQGHVRAIYNAARIYDLTSFEGANSQIARSLFNKAAKKVIGKLRFFMGCTYLMV